MLETSQILLLLAGFQVKHYLGDYQLQTRAMVEHKGVYLHPAGLWHAAVHGVLTLGLLLLFPVALWLCLALACVEAALHYHIDWLKERVTEKRGIAAASPLFWKAVGLDQGLHQLTYLLIALVLAA